MTDIATLLYQYLRSQFSGLDWTQGSVIRELVAEPMVGLATQATTAVNNVYNSMDISVLETDPEGNADAIDQLFNTLGLVTPATTVASGVVRVLLTQDTAADVGIALGTNFTFEDVTLSVDQAYTATVSPSAGQLKLQQVGYNTYAIDLPVVTTTGVGGLSEGTPLAWHGAPSSVYSASVYSAITGGVSPYTATQKLNLIRQRLVPRSLTCREGLVRTLNGETPDLVVDCLPKQQSTGGVVQLYTKTVAAPQVWKITATASPVYESSSYTGKYSATISNTGIYNIRQVTDSSANEITLESTTIDGRYTTIQYEMLTDTGDQSIELEVVGLQQLTDAQQVIDRYTANTGVRINVQPPRLLQLSIYLPTNGNINTTAMTDIVSAVNNSLLNASTIGDSTVTPILAKYNLTLNGTGTYTLQDYVTKKTLSSLSNINPTPFLTTMEPYAIYTSLDKISYGETI